eukprot:715746-Hanusia_phi.AAC.1
MRRCFKHQEGWTEAALRFKEEGLISCLLVDIESAGPSLAHTALTVLSSLLLNREPLKIFLDNKFGLRNFTK